MAIIEYGIIKPGNSLKGTLKKKDLAPYVKFHIRKPVSEINFALHFGSSICPPIAVYSAATIHRQLQSIVSHYLEVNFNFLLFCFFEIYFFFIFIFRKILK